MYEVFLVPKPGFLYKKVNGKLYGRINCAVVHAEEQWVPAPLPEEIVVNNTDATVELNVRGDISDSISLNNGTFFIPLTTLATNLDEAGVRNAVGNTVYNITINTSYDNTPQQTGSGTINNNSDIDID